jgi:hypothetical protein
MASINFKTLHTNIKASLVALGWRYVPIKKWYSFELGVFPTALKNDSFTIRFPDLSPSSVESDGWGLLTVSIEFVLDSQNEQYLTKLNDCVDAIVGLRSLSSTEIKLITEVNPFFQSLDVLDKVMVTFSDIKFDVRSIT